MKIKNNTEKGMRWQGAYLNPGERAVLKDGIVLKERNHKDFEEKFWNKDKDNVLIEKKQTKKSKIKKGE